MIDLNILTLLAINAAIKAGNKILEVYNSNDFDIKFKEDKSPLTMADVLSNNEIKKELEKSSLPVLSEEDKKIEYSKRATWKILWLIDPLDGTKEFIKRNGEFTVNIALIENGYPIAGVVYVPCLGELYYANKNEGSYKFVIRSNRLIFKSLNELIKISNKLPTEKTGSIYKVVGSRSHMSEETMEFIKSIKSKYGEIDIVSKGSSLKLCLVAEGKADIYPRFGPTMEWDTAAGHAIVKFSGAHIYQTDNPSELKYNKKNLLNPYFIAERKK